MENRAASAAIDENKRIIKIAIKHRCKINFRYVNEKGEETRRTVHPWVLFQYRTFGSGVIYVYVAGFCELRGELRTFRLDRMSGVTLVNEYIFFEDIDIGSLKDKFDDTFIGKAKILKSVCELNNQLSISQDGSARKSSVDGKVYGYYGAKPVLRQKPSWVDEVGADKEYPKPWHSLKLTNSLGKCRSPLEEKVMTALDEDDEVVGYEIEPFKIRFWAGSVQRFYTPDLLVTYSNGRKVIVEIKSKRDVSLAINLAKFQAIEQYAIENGYTFEVWTVGPGGVVTSIPWKDRAITSFEGRRRGISSQKKQESGCLTVVIIFIIIIFLLWVRA